VTIRRQIDDALDVLGLFGKSYEDLDDEELLILEDVKRLHRVDRATRKGELVYKFQAEATSRAGPLTQAVQAISQSPTLSRQAKAIMLADLAEDAEAMLERHENAQTFELWDNHPAWQPTPRIRSLARKSLGLDPDQVSDGAVDYLVGKAIRQVGAMSVRDLARRSSGLDGPALPGTWATGFK
jgi:hypothetical protein